jgi:hypothetical protein
MSTTRLKSTWTPQQFAAAGVSPYAVEQAEDDGVPQHVAPSVSERLTLAGVAEQLGVAVTREAFEQIGKLGQGQQRSSTAALWIAVAALGIVVVMLGGAFGVHLLGDESTRARTARTECHVDWLVRRAVAEDAGLPPPSFSPLECMP